MVLLVGQGMGASLIVPGKQTTIRISTFPFDFAPGVQRLTP
jgi:hypothetical protein